MRNRHFAIQLGVASVAFSVFRIASLGVVGYFDRLPMLVGASSFPSELIAVSILAMGFVYFLAGLAVGAAINRLAQPETSSLSRWAMGLSILAVLQLAGASRLVIG
ncbi:MAG: hypothetical protein KBF21_09355 [Thermoanaerobaculia bacterium]|nr:hypothetical protein [Thermoanaerobaculia bacterium]